jgi:hypothetical protein
LKSHALQRVVRVRLSAEVMDDGSVHADIGFNLRERTGSGGGFDYAAGAYCEARGEAISCPSEWDAGSFLIERKGADILVSNKGMIVNPSNYDSEDIAPGSVDLSKSDDTSWLLRHSDDEGCDIY